MHGLVEIVLHVLASLLWWVILLPVVWLVATPGILFLAVFSKKRDRQAVGEMYSGLTDLWKEWGDLLIP